MFRRAGIVSIVGLLCAVLIAGCTRKEQSTSKAAAPDFTLQDLAGKDVRLADLKGKVVLVEFWATWCPPCRESIPGMERLHASYKDKGLVTLGISLDDEEEWEDVRKFAAEHGISYPVLKGNEDVSEKFLVRVIPTVYLVNREGIIAKQYVGGGIDEALEKEIRALL